jgi:hypothetical protein
MQLPVGIITLFVFASGCTYKKEESNHIHFCHFMQQRSHHAIPWNTEMSIQTDCHIW